MWSASQDVSHSEGTVTMNITKRYLGRRTAKEVAELVSKVLGTLALASAVTCAAPAASSTASGGSFTQGSEASVAAVETPDPEDRGQECDLNQAADCKNSWRTDYENAQHGTRR
jgi:hypothetical protein